MRDELTRRIEEYLSRENCIISYSFVEHSSKSSAENESRQTRCRQKSLRESILLLIVVVLEPLCESSNIFFEPCGEKGSSCLIVVIESYNETTGRRIIESCTTQTWSAAKKLDACCSSQTDDSNSADESTTTQGQLGPKSLRCGC